MRSKRGLGVLLLAGLLSAIAVWFLPANPVAADILLLITSGAVTHKTTQTEASEIRTSGKLYTLKTVSVEETNTPHVSDFVTDFAEDNVTLSAAQTHYPVTPCNETSSTESPGSSGTVADLTSDVHTDTASSSGTESNNHTRSYTSLDLVDKLTVTPDTNVGVKETAKTVCDSGPNNSEVLAMVIGAVFLTMLLSALFYQFAVFIRNKRVHRDSSVYIIENEIHKNDVEANGLQPETKF